MLKIRHDFISYDQLDWANEFEVEIRFIVELLAHIYGKSTKHIVKVLCASDIDLPRLRYESSEIDDSSDPQWIRSRYCTVLHCKDLLSNTIEAERWTQFSPTAATRSKADVSRRGFATPCIQRQLSPEAAVQMARSGPNRMAALGQKRTTKDPATRAGSVTRLP